MCTEIEDKPICIVNEFSIIRKNKDEFIIEIFSSNRFFTVDKNIVELIELWSSIDNLKKALKIITNDSNIESHIVDSKGKALFDALSIKDSKRNSSLQNYLKFKVIIFNEKRTLFFVRSLWRLINPVVCTFFVLLFLIMLGVNHVMLNLLAPNSILLLCYYIILVVFHELGHASALYKFTNESCSIGFGIYLIRPVLFADVTKAWSLDKFKRIVINVSGIYYEFILLTLVSFFLLINSMNINNLVILFFIRCFYNLNPFFRTDGYWVISDYFDISNLRVKSNIQIKRFFSSKRKRYSFNYYLIFYSLISYLIIFFFVGKIINSNYSKIINFPINLYKIIRNGTGIDFFVEDFFIVIIIYLYGFYWIVKKISQSIRNKCIH